jgi:HK97 gp10 family phage protein
MANDLTALKASIQRKITALQNAQALSKEAAGEWAEQDYLPVVRQITPVRSGHLRDSNTFEVTDTAVRVENTAGYAGYVEEGTSKMAAQPSIEPALRRTIDTLGKRIVAKIKDAWK